MYCILLIFNESQTAFLPFSQLYTISLLAKCSGDEKALFVFENQFLTKCRLLPFKRSKAGSSVRNALPGIFFFFNQVW